MGIDIAMDLPCVFDRLLVVPNDLRMLSLSYTDDTAFPFSRPTLYLYPRTFAPPWYRLKGLSGDGILDWEVSSVLRPKSIFEILVYDKILELLVHRDRHRGRHPLHLRGDQTRIEFRFRARLLRKLGAHPAGLLHRLPIGDDITLIDLGVVDPCSPDAALLGALKVFGGSGYLYGRLRPYIPCCGPDGEGDWNATRQLLVETVARHGADFPLENPVQAFERVKPRLQAEMDEAFALPFTTGGTP